MLPIFLIHQCALYANYQFVYSRNISQFGMNGRFLFVRLNLSF
ncbi:hypothetical protein [Chryseobacterium indologenes]|nr:hypothetical protein [Chryseobacterium indologenes]